MMSSKVLCDLGLPVSHTRQYRFMYIVRCMVALGNTHRWSAESVTGSGTVRCIWKFLALLGLYKHIIADIHYDCALANHCRELTDVLFRYIFFHSGLI